MPVRCFEREIALHARGAEHIAEVRFFEMGLHDRPDLLRATLQENLDAVDSRTDIEAVVLAYGLCGRGTAGLRPLRHKLVIPRAHDCITRVHGQQGSLCRTSAPLPDMLLLHARLESRRGACPGPEKLEALRAELAAKFEPDDVEFLLETEREQWALHDTATFIDLGTDDAEAEADYARKCADWLGWKFEHLRGDPALVERPCSGATGTRNAFKLSNPACNWATRRTNPSCAPNRCRLNHLNHEATAQIQVELESGERREISVAAATTARWRMCWRLTVCR